MCYIKQTSNGVKKVLALLFLVSFIVVPAMTFASCNADGKCTAGETTADCPSDCPVIEDVAGLITLVNKIGNWVFAALMAVAGTFLIVAGLMWVTAGGSPERLTKARQMLINALIGVAIGLLARGIVMVISSVIRG